MLGGERMKRLVFKKWVEFIVVLLFFIGIWGIIFGCLFALKNVIMISYAISAINYLLLVKWGRSYKEEDNV